MKHDKLLAEWFWVDRWDGSSASLLPLEPRGLYREMLSQSWRRGARLPNDPELIRRAVRCTKREWNRAWPKVKGYWRVDGDFLVNDTQLDIYKTTVGLSEVRSRVGSKGGSKTQANRKANGEANLEANGQAKLKPPSPSPTKVLVTPSVVIETDSRASARAKSGSWSEQACDDWIERHGGTAPGGQIGRHLRLLVEKHGWETVRRAWRAYLAETEAEYANPSRFAATFGTWNRAPVATAPVPPPEVPEQASQDDSAKHFVETMVLALKETIPLNSWATWIRPIEGWAWLDSGSVLEIAAPSPAHAEMLRGMYREKLRAAAGQLGKTLKFKVFVRQDDTPALHNGSVR